VASIERKVLEDAYKHVNKKYSDAGADNLAAKGPKILQSLQRNLKNRFPSPARSGEKDKRRSRV
jgi:hypothetical protein